MTEEKRYQVTWDDDAINVNNLPFTTLAAGNFYPDLKYPKMEQLIEDALNELDPTGTIPDTLLPIFASLLYNHFIQDYGIEQQLGCLEDGLKKHYHAEAIVVKGIK